MYSAYLPPFMGYPTIASLSCTSFFLVEMMCCLPVKLPWILPGAPLTFSGTPGNIQVDLDSSGIRNYHKQPYFVIQHFHADTFFRK